MSDLSTAAPEGAAPTADAGAPPEGAAPATSTPPAGGAPSQGTTPEGTAATADSHGSQEAADAANATAALSGDDVAFDALPAKWQAEVRRLRDESAESRVTAKRYSEPLSALDPHEQEWVLGLARDLGNSETQAEAARRMRAVADSLLEGVEPDPEQQKPLTYADYERIRKEEAAREQSEAAIQSVYEEAEALGYKKDTPDFALLMWLAANAEKQEQAGDLKAAHERVVAGRQHIIDSWIAEQKAKGANFPAQASATAGIPSQKPEPPKTFKDSRERAEARAAAARAALGK